MKYPIHIFYGPKLSSLPQNSILQYIQPFMNIMTNRPITGEVEGLEGVLLDFNAGLRLQIPKGNWHVKICDGSSGTVFFDSDVSEILLISAEKFFVAWEITLSLDENVVFFHRFSAAGQRVHFNFLSGGMGDHIVLFPHMEQFRRLHDCEAFCSVAPYLKELIEINFPEIQLYDDKMQDDMYATYYLAPSFNPVVMSEEIRTMPMEHFGNELLGTHLVQKRVYRPTEQRQIQEPYVCIAVQTSGTFKSWLNPNGWNDVVRYLKQLGYRVLCIDRNKEETDHGNVIHMPKEAEDFTGNLPLSQRVNLLAYADFFIGLPSGLSWLAWATDIPVILISGITAPWYEFSNPYRVVNRLVCHGCHNNTHIPWPDYETCPYHKDSSRAYECSKQISAQQVIEMIDLIRTNT